MCKKNKIVALIPARAGSKRLINKNLLLLGGKPLIAWTIAAALNCSDIDDVVVSTDSAKIKQTSLDFGAKVPFIRPDFLANDRASTDDVLMHAIKELKLTPEDIIVLLQPTSPLRNNEDISNALSMLHDENIQGVVSVCKCEHNPLWSNQLPRDMLMGGFVKPVIASKRSQDLPCYYRLNGAIYVYRVGFLNKHKSRLYSNEIKAIVMPVYKSIDIDNEDDFKFAEFLIMRSNDIEK